MSSRIIRQNSHFGLVLLGGHRSYVYHITVRHSVLQVTQHTTLNGNEEELGEREGERKSEGDKGGRKRIDRKSVV